jgi:uncharacterized membrane protein (DUF2068 family)
MTKAYSRWELRACGRHGHETFRPTGPGADDLAARLCTQTAAGPAWRCLRCGDFVPGPPRHEGPPDQAPIVLRGKALRDATILRVLAAERAIRGVVLLLAAYAVHRFEASQDSLQRLFDKDLPAFRDLGNRLHIDVDGSAIVRTARHLLTVKGRTLTLVAVLVAAYAVIELVEAVGLWKLKRWGEYFTVVATAAFLPLEVYELTEHVSVTKVAALVINAAAVVYLVVAKRLFGVRGGAEAYEAQRRGESLLEVEAAAGAAPLEDRVISPA